MISHFLNGVLPVFGIGAVGFILGWRGIFDFKMAMALNKFVMFIAMPALAFQLLANVQLEMFDFALLAGYLSSEVMMYAVGFLIARLTFKTDLKKNVCIKVISF